MPRKFNGLRGFFVFRYHASFKFLPGIYQDTGYSRARLSGRLQKTHPGQLLQESPLRKLWRAGEPETVRQAGRHYCPVPFTLIPEVAGGAAILIALKDTKGWAQAVLRLAGNRMERNRLRDAAKMQAARFSWEDSANQLLKLYEVTVASPKNSELG